MTGQQAFADQIVRNIVDGNVTTARGQLLQCNTLATLLVLELLAYEMNEDEINTHGTPINAAIAKLRRLCNRDGE
jgi:hypothetical protein